MRASMPVLVLGFISMASFALYAYTLAFTAPALVVRQANDFSTSTTESELRYAVMIDGGSSGSRIHVYAYKPATPLPELKLPSNTLKLKPGLSSYESDPPAAGESLTGLLEFAKKHVPEAHRAQTPIYLYATAGLRNVPAGIAEEILEACRIKLAASPFQFDSAFARLIPGREEGVYGWLAANYLDQRLHSSINHQQENSDQISPSDHPTIGVLEMGGASMQVSFVPADMNSADRNELVTVKLGSAVFPLYTHSYLNFGLEQAQLLLHKKRLRRRKNRANHAKPTHQPAPTQKSEGQQDEHEHQTATQEPEEPEQRQGNPCYARGLHFPSEPQSVAVANEPTEHSLPGTGSFKSCVAMVQSLFDRQANKKKKHCSGQKRRCSFNGVYMPKITTEQFYAIENFFYTAEFFNFHKSDHSFVNKLVENGNKYCSQDWHTTLSKHPKVPHDELAKYCFALAFMERFLHFGLELKYPEKHIKLVKQARGTPIDWSIGAVVFAMTANSHIHAPGEPIPHSSSTTLAPPTSQSSSTEGDFEKCSATGPCESSQSTSQSAASSWFDSQMHKLLLLACGSAIAAVIMHCIQRDRHYRGTCAGTPDCPMVDLRMVVLPSSSTASTHAPHNADAPHIHERREPEGTSPSVSPRQHVSLHLHAGGRHGSGESTELQHREHKHA